MTSTRPYLIRAMHEWMCDNGLTPHIIVDTTRLALELPPQVATQDGRLVLNVSPSATRGLRLGNDSLGFEARFGGVPCHLEIPPHAVMGIYARETGQGMMFPDQEPPPEGPAPDTASESRPRLKVVK
jgi:stringent starvation protein B